MEDRIHYLFRRYLENSCTRQEMEEFFECLRNSKVDGVVRDQIKKAYETIKENSSSLTYVDESGLLILNKSARDIAEPKSKNKGKRTLAVLSMTILVILPPLLLCIWWLRKPSHGFNTEVQAAPFLTRKSTDRSEYKYLLLPDSTQVWLNAGSSLDFPDHFDESKREVILSGEAYFDVKHADKVPFIIHTGEIETSVLGTAFNIKAYPGRKNVIIAVKRGRVRVSRNNQFVATLTVGQEIKLSNKDSDIARKNIAETEVAAWQQGNMQYEDESFEDVIADLERMYNVNIRVEKQTVQNLKISTSFRREIGIEEALQILCKLTDSNLKESDGYYTIQ